MDAFKTLWSKYLNNFNHGIDLNKTTLEAFYIDRNTNITKDVLKIFNTDKSSFMYFSGMHGNGKTTELHRIFNSLEENYFPIYICLSNEMNINTACWEDVFICIQANLFKLFEQNHYKIDPRIVNEIDRLFNMEGIKLDRTGKLIIPPAELLYHRDTLKNKVSNSIVQLISSTNNLIDSLKAQMHSKIVIIIDELEYISLIELWKMLCEYNYYLQQLNINIIFSLPNTVFYHEKITGSFNYFENIINLPIFNLSDKISNEKIKDNYSFFIKLLGKRIPLELFQDEAIELLIRFSGGVIKNFLSLVNQVLYQAHYSNVTNISTDLVAKVLDSKAQIFYRAIPKKDYDLLSQIAVNNCLNGINKDLEHLYLNSGIILEYISSEDIWFNLHPIVRSFILKESIFNWKTKKFYTHTSSKTLY